MSRVENDENAARSETILERLGDLLGESLLKLGTRGKSFNHTRYLAKSHDSSGRDIPNMRNSGEREQVVFAHRAEVDVAQKHEFTHLLRREIELGGVRQVSQRIDPEAVEEVGVGFGDAGRRGREARARRILANCGEDLGDGSLDAPSVDGGHGRLGGRDAG